MLNDTTPTEAAPLSVEEMRGFVGMAHNQVRPYPHEEARAIATAAELERVAKWFQGYYRDRDAMKAPHPPETDGAAYNSGRAEGRADLCAALRAVLDPDDSQHWNQDGLLSEVRRLVSLARTPAATADSVERPAHYTQGDVECIDAIKAQLSQDEYRGFLRGQVAKYLWRMGLKGDSRTDAAKSHWYLSRLMREIGGGK